MEKRIIRHSKTILLFLMIIIAIILCIPSITYLIENKTVDGFNSYYTYDLNGYKGKIAGTFDGIIVIGLLMIFSILYFYIVKESESIFKNIKYVWTY